VNPFTRRRSASWPPKLLPAPELSQEWREMPAAAMPAPLLAEIEQPLVRHRHCQDSHELVGWYGTPHCWMCGSPGLVGMAERVGVDQ
jgi:hypothetical protein